MADDAGSGTETDSVLSSTEPDDGEPQHESDPPAAPGADEHEQMQYLLAQHVFYVGNTDDDPEGAPAGFTAERMAQLSAKLAKRRRWTQRVEALAGEGAAREPAAAAAGVDRAAREPLCDDDGSECAC